MLSYCLKGIKSKESKNPKVVKKNKIKIILSPKCVVYDNKKSKFIERQEAEGLLSMTGKMHGRLFI